MCFSLILAYFLLDTACDARTGSYVFELYCETY